MALLHGVDISHWQGTPNLKTLKSRYDLTFIGVKATEGTGYTDPKFRKNWAHAKAAGLVRIAYHFARPEQSTADKQAKRLVAHADPGKGDLLCLDLEASDLNQSMTNAWAAEFGDALRDLAPGVTTVLYMGSGYAGNNTGRNLSRHFDYWWYPRYPSSRTTKRFPSKFNPKLIGNRTGWARPHIWQFTAWLKGGYDGNVSWLSLDQLTGGSSPAPSTGEDDVPGYVSLGITKPIELKTHQSVHVRFDKEYDDDGKQHGEPGGYPGILTDPSRYSITVELDGLKGNWQLVMAEKKDGKWEEVREYAPQTDQQRTLNGSLGKGEHLYLKLNSIEPCTVTKANVRCLYWG